MNNTETITCTRVPEDQRINHAGDLFGINFPLKLEPFIYGITDRIAEEYTGGYWDFFSLRNGGFYMAPSSNETFRVSCENGYEGTMSADALGIVACLYAYSNLSFRGDEFAQTCAEHYHLLREYMLEHAEVGSMLGAVD